MCATGSFSAVVSSPVVTQCIVSYGSSGYSGAGYGWSLLRTVSGSPVLGFVVPVLSLDPRRVTFIIFSGEFLRGISWAAF